MLGIPTDLKQYKFKSDIMSGSQGEDGGGAVYVNFRFQVYFVSSLCFSLNLIQWNHYNSSLTHYIKPNTNRFTYRQCRRSERVRTVASLFFCLSLKSSRWPASSSVQCNRFTKSRHLIEVQLIEAQLVLTQFMLSEVLWSFETCCLVWPRL